MGKVIPNFQLFIILALLCLLIFGMDKINLLNFPKTTFSYITIPIQSGLYKTGQGFGKQFFFIFTARFAAKENKALKEQIGELISENASLRTKLAETQSLLAQEESLDSKTYKLLVARPIGLDRYLQIDKGADDGVFVNQAVVVKDNFLGLVISVSPKTSKIKLLTDPDSKIAAFSINKEGKAKGVVTGQFSTEAVMDKILHDELIEKGDLVYSEGTEGFLPRGLILGRVIDIRQLANDVFKEAKVKPIFDIRDLELVFLIKD